jgi:hypothetical protein
MTSPGFITDAELEQLYPQEVHDQIARLLKIGSRQGLADLREEVFRMARAYDYGLALEPTHPRNSEIRKPLKNVQEHLFKLGLAIAHCNGYARTELGRGLSKARKERKLANGEDVLPYGHGCSNEALFDRESLGYFKESLISLYDHLNKITENLKTGGRPAGPEQETIRYLVEIWNRSYRKVPRGQSLGPFQELCELTLRPIATRRGKKLNLTATVRNVLYLYDLNPPVDGGRFKYFRIASERDEARQQQARAAMRHLTGAPDV